MHIPRIHDGDKVTYIGCCKEQLNWGNNDNPDDVLERGKEYTVKKMIFGSFLRFFKGEK